MSGYSTRQDSPTYSRGGLGSGIAVCEHGGGRRVGIRTFVVDRNGMLEDEDVEDSSRR